MCLQVHYPFIAEVVNESSFLLILKNELKSKVSAKSVLVF